MKPRRRYIPRKYVTLNAGKSRVLIYFENYLNQKTIQCDSKFHSVSLERSFFKDRNHVVNCIIVSLVEGWQGI